MDRPLAFSETLLYRVGWVGGFAVYRLRTGGVALVDGEDSNGTVDEMDRRAWCLSDDHARTLASMLHEASEPKDRA